MSETIVVNGERVAVTPAMRKKWKSNFAEMVRTNSAPGIKTDSTLFAQLERTDQRFDGEEKELQRRINLSRQKGYNPGPNDVYVPELALEAGDPLAWVPPTSGRKRVKQLQNRVARHYAKKQAQQHPKLAHDLADEMVKRMVKKDPKLALASKREQRQEANKRHGPQR